MRLVRVGGELERVGGRSERRLFVCHALAASSGGVVGGLGHC